MFRKRTVFIGETLRTALTLLSRPTDNLVLLNDIERKLLSDLLFEFKRYGFDPVPVLDHWLKCEESCPSLELLWRFHNNYILKLGTFIYFQRHYCSYLNDIFKHELSNEIDDPVTLSRSKIVLTDVLAIIVNLKNHKNDDFQIISEGILNNLIVKIVDLIELNQTPRWNYLKELKTVRSITENCLKEFALSHVIKLLNYNLSSLDVLTVLGIHTKQWTYNKLPENTRLLLAEVLEFVPLQTVTSEINNVIYRQDFNWKYLLSLISILVQCPQNAEVMKNLVDGWVKDAFEDKNTTLLLSVLIVARHCCSEKARYFSNYPTWFGALPLKTVSYFTFFFENLIQLVPHEPPLFLKIHVNKVPSAPTGCQSLLVDYISLAKTQLTDLNETIDYIGLFNDYHDTNEEGQESDVSRVLSLFKKSKEIPKPVLEASVFRRQYYEKTFLKRLLSVSEEVDPERAQLIKKLHSQGKIPSVLYRRWKSV